MLLLHNITRHKKFYEIGDQIFSHINELEILPLIDEQRIQRVNALQGLINKEVGRIPVGGVVYIFSRYNPESVSLVIYCEVDFIKPERGNRLKREYIKKYYLTGNINDTYKFRSEVSVDELTTLLDRTFTDFGNAVSR
jgi:hypothetical protein